MKKKGVRDEYSEIGVDEYYIKHGADYENPHEEIIQNILRKLDEENYIGHKILDLSCGSGEVSEFLMGRGHIAVGTDPYTSEAYEKRTGQKPLKLSFIDIVNGKLSENVDTIICSFAMHLCEESMLPFLLFRLGEISSTLIIISPNKRPKLSSIQSWKLIKKGEIDRVKFRVYKKSF